MADRKGSHESDVKRNAAQSQLEIVTNESNTTTESPSHNRRPMSFDMSGPVKSPPTSLKQQSRTFESGFSSGFKSGVVLEGDDDVMRVVLAHAKDAEPIERLLSFALIVNCIQMSVTAVKMVNAGFVAMKTTLGFRFGCPDCKIIISDIPDKFDSPQAFHEFRSPNCPHVHKDKEMQGAPASNTATETDGAADTSMAVDSGLGTSLPINQSLFITSQGASIAGSTAFGDVTANGNQESVTFDVIHKSKKASIMRHVELSTQGYRMRRSKLEHSMCVEKNRRKTFKERNSLDTRITRIYASSGLHLTEEPKGKLKLMCAWCEFSVDFTREMTTDKEIAKELLDKHVMDYHCDFITGREETMRNVPDLFDNECWGSLTKHTSLNEADPGDQLSGLQINYQQAKHPGMAVFERRKESFLTFPTDSTQQPELLIEAGYFYTSGKSDTVTCFMCGVVSSDWSINETPWQRHARSSTTCQHVMSQKGEEFVKNTISQYGEYRKSKNKNKNHTTGTLRPRMDRIVAQTAVRDGEYVAPVQATNTNCLEMGGEFTDSFAKALESGYQLEDVKRVFQENFMAGNGFCSAETLIRALQAASSQDIGVSAERPLPVVVSAPCLETGEKESQDTSVRPKSVERRKEVGNTNILAGKKAQGSSEEAEHRCKGAYSLAELRRLKAELRRMVLQLQGEAAENESENRMLIQAFSELLGEYNTLDEKMERARQEWTTLQKRVQTLQKKLEAKHTAAGVVDHADESDDKPATTSN